MVDSLFQFHQLNERGVAKSKDIAQAFDDLLFKLAGLCNGDGRNSREYALVKTNLEIAAMYAKKAMSMRTENQVTW